MTPPQAMTPPHAMTPPEAVGPRPASGRPGRAPVLAALLAGLLFAAAAWEAVPASAQIQIPSVVETVERGYLAHRRGDYAQAVEIYTSIIRRRGLSVKERAVSYLLRGEARRDNGELEEAVLDFTRALNQWPNYPQAIFFRGQVLARLDRLNEAYADLSRAVELDPDRESYHTNLALLRKRMAEAGMEPPDAPAQPVIEVGEE
jgi:tetratricopeptide (TPR) repeat protein